MQLINKLVEIDVNISIDVKLKKKSGTKIQPHVFHILPKMTRKNILKLKL